MVTVRGTGAPMPFADGIIKISQTELSGGIDVTQVQGELFQLLCRESLPIVRTSLRSSVRIFQDSPIRLSRFVAVAGKDWLPQQVAGTYEEVGSCAGARAIARRAPYVVQTGIKADPYCQDHREILPDVASHASLPILSRRLNAVLSVDSGTEQAFPAEVLTELEFMTTKAAWVLDHLAQQEATWLLDLEREISKSKDVETLCRNALDRTVKMFGVQGGSIFLWDEAEKLLRCAATLPKAGEWRQVPPYRLGQGLTGWVAETRQILRLHDVASDEERHRIDPGLDWVNQYSELADPTEVIGRRTFLAAPLEVQDDLIGVVRLTVKQDYADFTQNDDALIESLVATLALAIQNIQNHERSRRRRMQLEIFDQLGAAATDTQSIAEVILENGLQIVNCDEGHIRIYDREKKTLNMAYSVGTHAALLENERQLGSGVSGRVAEHRQPLAFKDITTDPEFQQILAAEPDLLHKISMSGIRSEVCYPLVSGTDLVGTLSFHWRQEKDFSKDDRSRLKILVDRGALALGAALAFHDREEEVKRYRSALDRLHRLGIELTQHQPDTDKLFRMCLLDAIAETGITSGTIRTLNGGRDAWVLRTAIEDDPGYPGVECLQESLPANLRLLREASSKREATKIFDTDADEAFLEFKAYFRPQYRSHLEYLETVKSMLIAPMWVGEICKGLIFLCSHTPHDLSERNAIYLEILAAEAAIAIHNAELLAHKEALLNTAGPLALIGVAYGGLQHVLGSSIEVMLTIADTLRHPTFMPAELPETVDELRAVLERLAQYRKDVIAFLHPRTAIEEEIDINRAVRRALLEHSHKCGGVTLELDLASNLPRTIGNYLSIQQAFSMLIGNALDALHGNGKLRISTSLSQNDIRIRFEDTGDGMDAATRERAGEVFFSTKGTKGTGLGLAMVKSVVSRHRGKWEIVSSEPGEGTIIDVYLPPVEQLNDATAATR